MTVTLMVGVVDVERMACHKSAPFTTHGMPTPLNGVEAPADG